MQAIMISQNSRMCCLIANDKKPIILTKTLPKIETPFKCYIYVSAKKPYIAWGDVFRGNWDTEIALLSGYGKTMAEKIFDLFNAKVIGEFVCDDVEEYAYSTSDGVDIDDDDLLETCMEREEINIYAKGETIYGLHISNLEIYDCPKTLRDFYVIDEDEVKKCPYREQNYFAFTDTGHIKNGFGCKKHEDEWCFRCKTKPMSNPPSPWCYIAGVNEDE